MLIGNRHDLTQSNGRRDAAFTPKITTRQRLLRLESLYVYTGRIYVHLQSKETFTFLVYHLIPTVKVWGHQCTEMLCVTQTWAKLDTPPIAPFAPATICLWRYSPGLPPPPTQPHGLRGKPDEHGSHTLEGVKRGWAAALDSSHDLISHVFQSPET